MAAVGIDLWEPRFRVRGVYVTATADTIAAGAADIRIEVDWRPRGHLGDPTVEGQRTIKILLGGSVATVT